jgi:two-component system, OmpR family, phosphate regulon sensor histidine kinase PhoR
LTNAETAHAPAERDSVRRRLARRLHWRKRARATVAKRRVQLVLLILLVLLGAVLATGVAAAFSLYRSAENRYIRDVFPLREATDDIVLQVVNEETGVRGYMLTTDRQSLKPYFSGRAKIAKDLTRIEALAGPHPEVAALLPQLRREIRRLRAYDERLITFVADGKLGQARAASEALSGQTLFNRFRDTSAKMKADIESSFQLARASQRRTFAGAVGTLAVAGFFALAIAGTLLFSVPERMRLLYAKEEEARIRAERGANAARALEHVSDAVLLVDESGLVRSWNSAAERLFGVEPVVAVGTPAEDVVPDYARLVESASDIETLVPVAVGDEERWLAAAVSRFEGGSVLTIRDATAAHLLERARVDFVATASHELRTPLTAIYGGVRTLLGRGDRLDEHQRLRMLRMIEQESTQLSQIVDQLLITAQVDDDRLRLKEEPVDVPALCASVLEAADSRKPAKVALALDTPPKLAPLPCDEALLRQVLVNLVENALKYSPDGGRVGVRVADESDSVRIEVRDQGLGIPPSEQQRVFEKFYRLDPEMARGIGGSGLGLYISRKIVEQMDGSLSVHSAPGVGSTFTVLLPRRTTASVA